MNKNTANDVSNFIAILVIAGFVVLLISVIAYSLGIPEKLFNLTDETGKVQPNNVNGDFFKFILLIVGGIIAIYGLMVNYKRLEITNRQVEQQTEQVKIAIKQIQLAEKTQINTRFKDAAQLLASEHTSAILSGIYALDQIVVEVSQSDDEQYKGYVKVVHDILCAYLRENSILDELGKPIKRNRPDIVFQTIVSQLFVNNKAVYNGLEAELQKTYLAGLYLEGANLQRTVLLFTNLQYTILKRADLQSAFLALANLQGASLQGAKLNETDFSNAEMDVDTNFSGTCLADYSIEEITRSGNSRKLTNTLEI